MNTNPRLTHRARSAWLPMWVSLLGLALTAAGVKLERARDSESDRQRFVTLTERVKGEITRRVGLYRSGLLGFRGLYLAQPDLRRLQLQTAVESRDIGREFPGALGVGYIQWVQRAEVPDFLARTRADGAPDFRLKTKGEADDLMIIESIFPYGPNQNARGYDIGQETNRRAGATHAALTGEAALTSKINLVQATHSGPGFLYLLPLYRPGRATTTASERRAALRGWVYMPIVASGIFKGIAAIADGELDFEVFEDATRNIESLIYDDDDHLARERKRGRDPKSVDPGALSSILHLDVGGRKWTVTMRTTSRFVSQSTGPAWSLGIAGSVFSLMLGLFLRTQTSATQRAQALADSMTADLRRLAMVAEHSTNAVLIMDSQHRVSWTNRGYTRITGIEPEGVIGAPFTQTLDPVASNHELELLTRALETGVAYRGELRRLGRAGDTRWLDADVQPLLDQAGNRLGFVSVETDITEKQRSRLALEESQAKLQLILDSTDEAIFGIDLEGRFTFCNTACVQQLGYTSAAELLGRPSHALMHHTKPDGSAYPRQECPIYRALKSGSKCRVATEHYFRSDGTSFPVEYSCHPQRVGDQVLGAVVAFVDITERLRLEAESELASRQLALSNAALEEAQSIGRLGNWRIALPSWQMQWSKQLYSLFERDPAQGPPDCPSWQAAFTSEDAAVHLQLLQSAAEQGKSYSIVLRTHAHARGVRHVRVEGRARVEAQQVIELFGTAMDVTAEIEHAEKLRVAQRQAEDASRSKSEFLANMSHEIRTPMTAILGYADLIAEDGALGPSGEQRREYCETIKRNGEHLLSIINDVLDISKIEAGMLTIEYRETQLHAIVQEVISTMSVKANAKGLKLEYVYSSAIPTTIRTDSVRLRQILINLVGNAVKFTEIGGVTVHAAYEDGPRPRVRFDIADTGIGLTAEQGARLFGAFQQADSSTTRKFGGSGLGLLISKRLAQMLGGDISFKSTPGKGSVFSVTLEAGLMQGLPQASSTTRAQDPVLPRSPAASNDAPLRGVRILFAEDGQDNQRLIAHHLRKAGASVQIVENGRAAVELLTTDGTLDGAYRADAPIDLILSDMQMPEMDGYAATRLLRAKGCPLPIVALTAHAMSDDADRCLAAGCDAYATKPIERKQLLEICRQAVVEYRQRCALVEGAGVATSRGGRP